MTKVWVIGLSRTGTTSITKLLNNYALLRIDHFPSLKSLNGYWYPNDGASDIPVSFMYKELDRKHPNSKFILTKREKESWLTSTENFITTKDRLKSERGVELNPDTLMMREKIYGSQSFDRETWSNGYDTYHADVREYFANRPSNLLEIDFVTGNGVPKDVFEFLGITTIPPKKFPKVNVGAPK